jgi:hypothetical protein
MRCCSRLRIGGSMVAALSLAALLTSGQTAAAQPLGNQTAAGSCSSVLNGYKPVFAQDYGASWPAAGGGYNDLSLQTSQDAATSSISGTVIYTIPTGDVYTGHFTGTASSGNVEVKGDVDITGTGVSYKINFSFTGVATCLMSLINTTNFTSPNPGFAPRIMNFQSECNSPGLIAIGGEIACIAKQIRDGIPQIAYLNPVPKGGAIPYVSGGGHGTDPGLFNRYDEPVNGLDCSGFTRIVYALAYGTDVLKDGKALGVTLGQWAVTTSSTDGAGDLVFFKESDGTITHVGINLGSGFMLDEPNKKAALRAESISKFASADDETYSFRRYN